MRLLPTWLMGTEPSYSTGCTRSALHQGRGAVPFRSASAWPVLRAAITPQTPAAAVRQGSSHLQPTWRSQGPPTAHQGANLAALKLG